MRLARRCIRDLDAALAATGELVRLARLHDAPDGGQVAFYCERIPAKATLIQPQEIMTIGSGGSIQDSTIIISPTRLAARKWPAPPQKDDRIWITEANGRERVGNIEVVLERRVQGAVVRYEIKTRT